MDAETSKPAETPPAELHMGRVQAPAPDVIKVKRLEAETLVIRRAGSPSFATVEAGPTWTGFWVGSGNANVGLVIQDHADPLFVVHDQNGNARTVTLDAVLASVAATHPGACAALTGPDFKPPAS